ncbi:Myb-like_DNA-binding domain-containing protein [Hexamita inflata]|uniref:Myb-like DNA-binding domain-containing protein n=1 Tax=Hexamita inflata TaxID=28002 RepID=A0AA86U057_9EUKA|nr:Myb-like DNA-binding domain-containing protein [Hexamita inflata]CAI9926639.1 Myb-like DNA-binding domain-containing protein [Hexamita inflata]
MDFEMQKTYKPWSDEEMLHVISCVKKYKTRIINWDMVASHTEGRTAQQCKSFYNNRGRKFEFAAVLKKYDMRELGFRWYSYLLNSNYQHETDPVKRIYLDNAIMDMITYATLVQNDVMSFKYDPNMLSLIHSIITIHCQYTPKLMDQIEKHGSAKLSEEVIYVEQLNQFIRLMNSLDYITVYQKVKILLSQQ